MTLSTETAFVKPYFIEELGCEGLSSEDIARSLNVKHFIVTKKINNNADFFRRMGWQPFGCDLLDVQGRSVQGFLLDVTTAKWLVSSWKSERGGGYFEFLLECERIATELTPKLVAENADLKAQIVILQGMLGTKQKRVRKPKTGLLRERVVDLLGQEIMVATRQPIESLTELEILDGRLCALVAQQDGLASKIRWLEEQVAILKDRKQKQTELERDCLRTIRPTPRKVEKAKTETEILH